MYLLRSFMGQSRRISTAVLTQRTLGPEDYICGFAKSFPTMAMMFRTTLMVLRLDEYLKRPGTIPKPTAVGNVHLAVRQIA